MMKREHSLVMHSFVVDVLLLMILFCLHEL